MAAALDGPLPPPARAALDDHLRECGACRAVWEALVEIDSLLAAAPAVAPPAGFAARMNARMAARSSRRRTIGGGFILALAALALLVLVGAPLAGLAVALLRQPDAIIGLARALAALINVCGAVGGGLWLALTALLDWTAGQPLAGGLTLAALPLVWAWLYLFQRLSPKAVSAR
jgi:anti-sigma factor RsiW